jgi:hypothetical protein
MVIPTPPTAALPSSSSTTLVLTDPSEVPPAVPPKDNPPDYTSLAGMPSTSRPASAHSRSLTQRLPPRYSETLGVLLAAEKVLEDLDHGNDQVSELPKERDDTPDEA